jgi:hypothetical protein
MKGTRALGLFIALLLIPAGVLLAAPGEAQAQSNQSWGSGSTLRAKQYELLNEAGHTITWWSSKSCTSSYKDVDQSMAVMPSGWNDDVSSIADFNLCDTLLWWDYIGDASGTYGWTDAGSGENLNWLWNNETSAIQLT